jgi:capsid protein
MQRRLVAWRAGGESINSLILQGGELERARAHQLVRTNPYAANASASFTGHAVGCGIKPSSLVEDGALKDEIQRLWLAWTDEADLWPDRLLRPPEHGGAGDVRGGRVLPPVPPAPPG